MSLSINQSASRPAHAASAVRLSFLALGVIASLAVGKALLAQGLTTPAMAEPAGVAAGVVAEALPIATTEPAKSECRQVQVEIDEGYGVRGHVTRWVCRKAG
jgi:hypothetical protein